MSIIANRPRWFARRFVPTAIAVVVSALATAVTFLIAPPAVADECGTGTYPYCIGGSPAPNPGCAWIGPICLPTPNPGPVPPPVPLPPPNIPPPATPPPPYLLVTDGQALSLDNMLERGFTFRPDTDPKTGDPIEVYSTNPGILIDLATRQKIAIRRQNGLNQLANGQWQCSDYDDLETVRSVVSCKRMNANSALPASFVTVLGLGHSFDGDYPAPATRETYTPRGVYDAFKTGRFLGDPVLESLGVTTIVVAPVVVYVGAKIALASPAATALGAAISTAATQAAKAPGATWQSVSRAASDAWIATRHLSGVAASRVTSFVDKLSARIPGSLTDLARRLGDAAGGPMGPLVESDSPLVTQLIARISGRLLSGQLAAYDALTNKLGAIVNSNFGLTTLQRMHIISALGRYKDQIFRIVMEFEAKYGYSPEYVSIDWARLGYQTIAGKSTHVIELMITVGHRSGSVQSKLQFVPTGL